MSAARRGGSGGRAVVVLLIVAAVLLGGLYLGDRYARRQVEARVAVDLQTQLGTPERPQVTIDDFPFLTQVATQSIRSVHVVADRVGQTNGAAVVIDHADLVLSDVTSRDRFATMTVSHAEGTALVGYPQLQTLAGVPLRYIGGGRFQVESDTTVLSVPVKAVITGGLALQPADQTVTFSDPQVKVGDVTLPEVAGQALLRGVLKPIPVRGLPFGLTLTAIRAEDDGLHADIAGDHIPMSR